MADLTGRHTAQRDAGDVRAQFCFNHVEHGGFMRIFDRFKFGQHRGSVRRCRPPNCVPGRGTSAAAAHYLRGWTLIAALVTGLIAAIPAQAAPALELLVLGSGGPGAAGRAGSAYLVLLDGKPRILVDAGPGSFARLGESGESLADTDVVLLTHLHIDHVGELPGLFKARAVSSSGPITFRVWGPDGAAARGESAYFPSTEQFVASLFGRQGAFAYLQDFAAPMRIDVNQIPTHGAPRTEPQMIYQQAGFAVKAIPGHHGDAPAVIYRIDAAGKSITFSGDIDAHALPALQRIAADTDLLVIDTVVLDPPGSAPILYTLHTPPKRIGELAHDSGARRLLLSHLSPATDQMRDAVQESIRRSYAGRVHFAQDGMRIEP